MRLRPDRLHFSISSSAALDRMSIELIGRAASSRDVGARAPPHTAAFSVEKFCCGSRGLRRDRDALP
jgi:hypothetical protein